MLCSYVYPFGPLLWPLLQAALLNLHVNLKGRLFIRCVATNSAAKAKGKGQSKAAF
jgi:hypothetical protein